MTTTNRVREHRLAALLSAAERGELVGVSKSAITAIERWYSPRRPQDGTQDRRGTRHAAVGPVAADTAEATS